MIELRGVPTQVTVASLAGGRKSECSVGRIGRGIEILRMAAIAFGRCAPILRSMATGAIGVGVPVPQGECRWMPETGHVPADRHRLMALLAIARKARQRVIGVVRLLEIRPMANPAFL